MLTGNPLLRRSDVITEVGPDAFDYGRLIGHEDAHRLIQDETADIVVTFAHRSIQEFLGAFYFIQALDKGERIDSLQGYSVEPLFMTNPLFFSFCLWFTQHSQGYFVFKNIENVHHIIQKYILNKINTSHLDFYSISSKFPALDIEKAIQNKDTTGLAVYGNMLSKCHNVRTITLESSDSVDWVLTSLRRVLPSITFIEATNCFVMKRIGNVLAIKNLLFSERTFLYIDTIQVLHRHFNTYLSLFIDGCYRNNCVALLSKLNTSLKTVCFDSHGDTLNQNRQEPLPPFTNLHHMSFKIISFHKDEICYLSKAQRDGNFPSLTDLNFTKCYDLKSNFSLLFSSPWSRLIHLGFYDCALDNKNYEMIGNMKDNLFPNLLSLSLAGVINSFALAHLRARFPTLESMYLRTPNITNAINWTLYSNLKHLHLVEPYPDGQRSISQQCLPRFPISLTLNSCVNDLEILANSLSRDNIKHLDISFNKRIGGTLSVMLYGNFPSLRTLILHDCALKTRDLSSLAQASVSGRLQKLRHLNISNNRPRTNSLFHHSCKWNQLLSLNIMRTGFSPDMLSRKFQSGCLSSLQELRISGYPLEPVAVIYPHLQILGIDRTYQVEIDLLLSNIEDAVVKGKFPSLHSVCMNPENSPPHSSYHRLSTRNVTCHKYTNLVESKCVCQQRYLYETLPQSVVSETNHHLHGLITHTTQVYEV